MQNLNANKETVDITNYKEGQRVYHKKFGEGTINKIEEEQKRQEELEKAKKLGLMPSFFVAHVYYWGDTHIKNFGLERANKISPLKSSLDKNIIFTLHQDSPVIEPNMFETIWCAVNRITKDGKVLGSDEIIEVLDAIKAVTINAAYQYFEENKKGSIREGKKADLIIVDKNPLKIDKNEIRKIKVLETIKDGEKL